MKYSQIQNTKVTVTLQFSYSRREYRYISQGSVAMHLRCDGIFNDH